MAKRPIILQPPRNGRSLLPQQTLTKMEQIYQGALAVCRKYNLKPSGYEDEKLDVKWRKRAKANKKKGPRSVSGPKGPPREGSKRGRIYAFLLEHRDEDAQTQATTLAALVDIPLSTARRIVRKYTAGVLTWAPRA